MTDVLNTQLLEVFLLCTTLPEYSMLLYHLVSTLNQYQS